MTLYKLPGGHSQASWGTMTCFTSDYDLVHWGPPLHQLQRWAWSTNRGAWWFALQVSRNQDSPPRGGGGVESLAWVDVLQEDGHTVSHRMNRDGLTGGLQHISQGDNHPPLNMDYDMIPKRMFDTHLYGDTACHIITKHWSHTCEPGTVSNGPWLALQRAHWSQGPFSSLHEVWTRHTWDDHVRPHRGVINLFTGCTVLWRGFMTNLE